MHNHHFHPVSLYRRCGDQQQSPAAVVKNSALLAGIVILCSLLAACGNPNQRLDEYVFYDGPEFKLKVVRSYRNIPFNYLGEHAVVMCQSEIPQNFRHMISRMQVGVCWAQGVARVAKMRSKLLLR